MTAVYTQQELADRWKVTVQSIENWRKEGVISQAKGVPVIRFTEQHILDLEGVKLDKFSPLERKRLETENIQLKLQNDKLKEILSKVLAETSQIINL